MAQYLSVFELSSLDGNNGFQINGELANENSGFSVSSAGDVNGDGFIDLIVGTPQSYAGGVHAGAAYVVFGTNEPFDATFELSALDGANGFEMDGELALDFAGFSVSSAGDINGDGFDDVIVGAWGADDNGSGSGASYVVFGKASGFVSALDLGTLDGNNGFQINGEASTDYSGQSVSSAGDVNGDGFGDMIVGARSSDANGASAGASWVVFGKASGFTATLELSALDGTNGFQINGEAALDQSGSSVAAGDINNDGFDDLIVGALGASPNGTSSGATYVVFGKGTAFSATLALSTLDGNNGFQINGEATSNLAGVSASAAGDVNADGFADFLIGTKASAGGISYVVFGKASGFTATLELSALDGNNGFQIDGEVSLDHAGSSVSSAGDFNGDGFDDILVGAYGADPHDSSSGAAYIVFGKASGFGATLALSSLDGNNGFQINGEAGGDEAGCSVSGAGDINGDGFDDLLVGAKSADPNGSGSGASYVIFGAAPGEAVTRTGTDIANIIHGSNFGDTLSGLGGDDALLGLGGNDGLNGGDDDDDMVGGAGKDDLVGGAGKDNLDGGGGKDTLVGGNGFDRLDGGAGKDTLDGELGVDTFVYGPASDSTGKQADVIGGANFAEDRFDLQVAIGGVDAAITSGTLRNGHFDDDLAAAVNAGNLAANHAVLFRADNGNLADLTFLVIDLNGAAGYQAAADLVVRLDTSAHLANLGVEDFI